MPDDSRKTETPRFPTRQYRYTAAPVALDGLSAPTLLRFVMGRDPHPVPIQPADLPPDPFARLILGAGSGPLPQTCRDLLARLDSFNGDPASGLPMQRSFVVADGGQIPWSPETADLERVFRIAITRSRPQPGSQPDILISTGTLFDSEEMFLQVIGWDPQNGAFQFYERRDGAWVWAGSSWDSLTPEARGKGPFDSHVNGALNMKELKAPWVHWHSQAAQITNAALAPDDPLRNEPIWINRSPAESYENDIVRPGILRWHAARFQGCTSADGKSLDRLDEFFRQVLGTSTVNLASASLSNARLATATADIPLPMSFFVNRDALFDLIGLEPDIDVPRVPPKVYRDTLVRYGVAITDGRHRFPGDTHFVFVVPEPAFEDNMILKGLLDRKILSPRLAASLLMVDFCNPLFSRRRSALLPYVPNSASLVNSGDFEQQFVAAVQVSANSQDALWKRTFEERIENFFSKLTPQMASEATFARVFELAESRRREFRRRPLAEFRLTTPVTNIQCIDPLLECTPDADIVPKPRTPDSIKKEDCY
jgi:hypothetical protein